MIEKTRICKRIMIYGLYIVVCGLFLSGCQKPMNKSTYVISGTYLEVISSDRSAGAIAYQEFQRLDKIFNLYYDKSEISRVNDSFNTPVKVSKEFIEVLFLAKQVCEMTNGAYDITRGALYRYWHELIKSGTITQLPSQTELNDLKVLGGFENIEINKNDSTITIKQKGLKLDCNSIVEGYMVDKAAMKLKKMGVKNVLLNAGGEIYGLGNNNGKPWIVGIQDPDDENKILGSEPLTNEAIATSGNYEQFFEIKGVKYSHIIDPFTGWPVQNGILGVSVITKNCTTAGSLGTGFFVMGIEKIQQFLKNNKSTMRIFAVTIGADGKHMQIFK